MGLGSFNLSEFSPRLLAALGYTIVSLFLFALFPLISGAGQGIHLLARGEGACELISGGVRFDRMAPVGTANSPNAVDWSGSDILTVTQTSGAETCTASTAPTAVPYYTPTGEKFTPTAAAVIDAGIAGWQDPASMFQDQPGLVGLVIGAIALIIGIGPLVIVGVLGYKALSYFRGSGAGGIAVGLMAALGAVIVVSLLATFVDFISIAYNAISPDRFSVYDTSLAALAGTIRQFWGVIFVASFLGLGGMFAFQGYQRYRQGRSGGMGKGESQMLG